MITHLEQEMQNLKVKIFEMADLAIEAIARSVESLETGNSDLARVVIDKDSQLDRLEIQIDDEAVKLLVTRQPAATDLRLVLSILKINTDLERIGDLASNIANEALHLNEIPPLKPLIDIPRMSALCIEMLKKSFESITARDEDLACSVIDQDRILDQINLQVYRELFSFMAEDPRTITHALSLIMVAKALERIGDHATNIAERAIYYIKGIDIRHSHQ